MLAVFGSAFGSAVEQRPVARGRLAADKPDRIPCIDEYVGNIRIGALEEQFHFALFEIDLIDTPFGLPEQCRAEGLFRAQCKEASELAERADGGFGVLKSRCAGITDLGASGFVTCEKLSVRSVSPYLNRFILRSNRYLQ